jgi:WD40 repeat protein
MVAIEGHRPERPNRDDAPQLTDDVWRLAERCWAGVAAARPSIDEACDEIATLSFPVVRSPGNNVVNVARPSIHKRVDPSSFSLVPFQLHHKHCVTSVTFSLDGTQIASGSVDQTIGLWDVHDGRLAIGPIKTHSIVYSVAFSPNGRHLVSGFATPPYIQMWNAQTGALVPIEFKAHTDGVNSIVFSPNGRQIASGSADKTIRIWDAQSGKDQFGPIGDQKSEFSSVVFSPNGLCVASGHYDAVNHVYVWSAKTGRLEAGPFQGHSHWVSSVAFSPNGRWVVSGSFDREIRVWDTEADVASSCIQCIREDEVVNSVAFGPDGQWIASGSLDGVRIWDLVAGKEVSVFRFTQGDWADNCFESVAVSPAGDCIVAGTRSGSIYMWK